MTNDQQEHMRPYASPFDAMRHIDGEREFWKARALSKILGYNRWENFENVIAKAKMACEQSRQAVAAHFLLTRKVVSIGKWGEREIVDYLLSRYALYLILIASDVKKPETLRFLIHFIRLSLGNNSEQHVLVKDLETAIPECILLTREQITIRQVIKAFKYITAIQQYRVLSYSVDLYFPQYRIAVECDEDGHRRYSKEAELKRQGLIERRLNCKFVRYNPDARDFNIGDVIHQIMMLIYQQEEG